MAIYVRPFVKSITHLEGCEKRHCGPACVRVTDGWEYDIRLKLPNGGLFKERKKSPVKSKANSLRYAEERAAHAIRESVAPDAKEEVTREGAPSWDEFWPRYIEEHCRANRLKPSTLTEKQLIYDFYLKPRMGPISVGETTDSLVAKLKAELAHLSPKTVNNVLINVSSPLKVAAKWGVIQRMPCTVELLKTAQGLVEFYEPSDYERLVEAARQLDPRIELLVLLGGDAGLRCGEIIAVEQSDVDLKRTLLHVRRSEWEGHVTLPKGGRERQVIMTERLRAALGKNRHLRGDRVLWRDDGHEKVTQVLLAKWMSRTQRRAGLKVTGGIHILRHTFCSRLAMLGAPAKAIQELAGHQSLSTTQRYMHLSPAAKSAAIELLNRAVNEEEASEKLGDIRETAQGLTKNP
ncbi:MAG TPA: site-specific integrase [Anaeromyxobacteraceae bacterium]|nr:site-specific integrase [Anaeromyxobacteraceae bacterium]